MEGVIALSFVRKVTNSNELANIINIPDELKNKQVEIIVLPYENMEKYDSKKRTGKSMRGVLADYQNEKLQVEEKGAWSKAAVNKHENS